MIYSITTIFHVFQLLSYNLAGLATNRGIWYHSSTTTEKTQMQRLTLGGMHVPEAWEPSLGKPVKILGFGMLSLVLAGALALVPFLAMCWFFMSSM